MAKQCGQAFSRRADWQDSDFPNEAPFGCSRVTFSYSRRSMFVWLTALFRKLCCLRWRCNAPTMLPVRADLPHRGNLSEDASVIPKSHQDPHREEGKAHERECRELELVRRERSPAWGNREVE